VPISCSLARNAPLRSFAVFSHTGVDLHMAQRIPLPLTVSCVSKIQIGFTFLVPAHPGSPGQRAVKRVCVCVCVCVTPCSPRCVCVLLLRRRQTNTVQSARFRALDEVAVCDINNCESRDAMSQFPAPAVDARRPATCLQCQEDDPGQRACLLSTTDFHVLTTNVADCSINMSITAHELITQLN